jgi:hypothetical protein
MESYIALLLAIIVVVGAGTFPETSNLQRNGNERIAPTSPTKLASTGLYRRICCAKLYFQFDARSRRLNILIQGQEVQMKLAEGRRVKTLLWCGLHLLF